MPQEFQVLRCFSCETFQVHQVKKSTKWSCKLCGEKQSLKKVFGRGTGADCRNHVQKLNNLRGELDSKQTLNSHMKMVEVPNFDSEMAAGSFSTKESTSSLGTGATTSNCAQATKWNVFLESQGTLTDPKNDSVDVGDDNEMYTMDASRFKQGKKRKRTSHHLESAQDRNNKWSKFSDSSSCTLKQSNDIESEYSELSAFHCNTYPKPDNECFVQNSVQSYTSEARGKQQDPETLIEPISSKWARWSEQDTSTEALETKPELRTKSQNASSRWAKWNVPETATEFLHQEDASANEQFTISEYKMNNLKSFEMGTKSCLEKKTKWDIFSEGTGSQSENSVTSENSEELGQRTLDSRSYVTLDRTVNGNSFCDGEIGNNLVDDTSVEQSHFSGSKWTDFIPVESSVEQAVIYKAEQLTNLNKHKSVYGEGFCETLTAKCSSAVADSCSRMMTQVTDYALNKTTSLSLSERQIDWSQAGKMAVNDRENIQKGCFSNKEIGISKVTGKQTGKENICNNNMKQTNSLFTIGNLEDADFEL